MVTPKNGQNGNVRVCCRLRPFNAKEFNQNERKCVQTSENIVYCKREAVSHEFQFDHVFTEQDDQLIVFDAVARPAVEDIIGGYNSTILTYGQTSSGKTYTMQGADNGGSETHGIVPRTALELFNRIHTADANLEFTTKVSYLEIYMEQVCDLLGPRKARVNLQIREDAGRGFFVENMMEMCVTSPEEFMHHVIEGTNKRAIAATQMNERSSRSHSVLMVTVSQRHIETQVVKSGKLFLVDLAGSEMVRKTEAVGQRLEEAKMINRSLSTLGIVINNLTDPNMSHVPYRDSKLTRILQDSLGGNSRTTLIVNISCSNMDSAETLSTLRFGSRAKKIKNQAVINERKSANDLINTVKALEKDLQLEKNRVTALKNRLECTTSYEIGLVTSIHQTLGLKTAASSAHDAAMPSDASIIETFRQLQKKFTNLEEELVEVQLESDRRGNKIQDLNDQLDSKNRSMESSELSWMEAEEENKRVVAKLELALKMKEIQYTELQSDHERLNFEHKELTIHAEKVEQQLDLLSSDEANRLSFCDTVESQSPCAANDMEWPPKRKVDFENDCMLERIPSTSTPSSSLEDVQQRLNVSVEMPLKDSIIQSVPVLASTNQTGVTSGLTEKERKHMQAIQQKLEHLVAVHRQLLRKFATSEMNAKEMKRKVAVRDDRIKKLEGSNRQITESLRKQAEKHVEELIRLRDQITDFRGAQRAHFESHGNTEGTLIKTLRGGGAAGPLYSFDHPRQCDDQVRPIHGGSQRASDSSTSKESISELEEKLRTEEAFQSSESFFYRLFRF